MDNNILDDSEISINSLLKYIIDNFYGLLLFVLVFIIIYIVDYINQINVGLMTVYNPNFPSTMGTINPVLIKPQKKSRKK